MTRRRGIVLAISAAAVLIVAGLAGGIWAASSRAASPEAAATALLRALESGDADAVAATGLEVPSEARAAFASARAHITAATVGEIAIDAGSATVQVSFSLDGASHTASLALALHDGRWTPESDVFGTIRLRAAPASVVRVGDALIEAAAPVALLPAVYPVIAVPEELVDGAASLTVVPGETRDAVVDATALPAAADAAQRALVQHVEENCLALGAEVAEGCGIRIPWGTEFRAVDSIRSRIEAAPTVRLDGTTFTADQGALVSTVSGVGLDGADRTATYRTGSWTLRGDVRFTETGVTLIVW